MTGDMGISTSNRHSLGLVLSAEFLHNLTSLSTTNAYVPMTLLHRKRLNAGHMRMLLPRPPSALAPTPLPSHPHPHFPPMFRLAAEEPEPEEILSVSNLPPPPPQSTRPPSPSAEEGRTAPLSPRRSPPNFVPAGVAANSKGTGVRSVPPPTHMHIHAREHAGVCMADRFIDLDTLGHEHD